MSASPSSQAPRALVTCLSAVLLASLPASRARADEASSPGGYIYASGMPPVLKGSAGAAVGWYAPRKTSLLNVLFHLGLSYDLTSPVVGLAALGVEGYVGYRGDDSADGGARALFLVPALHVGIGVDYNVPDEDFSALLRLDIPFRRGGTLGRGTQVRFQWLPNRSQTFSIGIDVPLWGETIGKTRPQRDSVELPDSKAAPVVAPRVPTRLATVLAELHESAQWICRLAMPLTDVGGADPESAYAEEIAALRRHLATASLSDEQQLFHARLNEAFAAVLPPSVAPSASAEARKLLLELVLLPYDRRLGQRKANDSLASFAASAQAAFSRWLLENRAPRDALTGATYVFQRVLDTVEEARRLQNQRWDDSRFVWLPLQLALREDDYDSQQELDAIIAKATGDDFTTGNHTAYVMNENFQLEFNRSVHAARFYHVLWIHDYRGANDKGEPDAIGFAQTVRGYLAAMTQRVREYDKSGVLPQYFVFLDQNYFEVNDTRLWFRVLLDPTDARVALPLRDRSWQKELEQAQKELRRAVAESKLLQAEAHQFGDAWLRNKIRVHVSITNPSDFSFTSLHVAGLFPVPDNVMRDHRKIVFYDVSESDPYRGRAMLTGTGIGEHYIGAGWEDRSLVIRGPAALLFKDAARDLLLQQGFSTEQIPSVLQAQPKAPDYATTVERVSAELSQAIPGYPGRVLVLHNQTGFADKPINVEKALLYSLMPQGAVALVPDSLWQSYVYASLLFGSALRGCRVLVMAPSLASAPSAAKPTMARTHGMLAALVVFERAFARQLDSKQGLFKIGLYAPQAGVGDVLARLRQTAAFKQPWKRKVFPHNPAVEKSLEGFEDALTAAGLKQAYLIFGTELSRPKLHLKATLLVDGRTLNTVLTRPEWGAVVRESLFYLARQAGPTEQRVPALEVPESLQRAVVALAQSLVRARAAGAPRSISYFTIGSANMDYRSMVMDGEVQVTLTGWSTLDGLLDFLILAGQCRWIETKAELDQLLPPPGGFTRRVANLIKLFL